MNIRTSQTHPLKIAEIRPVPTSGRIGITFCPGKWQPDGMQAHWERDLEIDLKAIKHWGAAWVLTLIEDHEILKLRVEGIGDRVTAHGMRWLHLPIPDVSVPDAAFEQAWDDVAHELREVVRSGSDIVVHCKGGLGRAGTIAARLLIEFGWPAERAIKAVRRVRSGAIETIGQEDYLRMLSDGAQMKLAREELHDRCLGAMIGLAVGDAVGTTLEFKTRDDYTHLVDMIGGGPFRLEAGQWTDDTSMALALADSLIRKGKLDKTDLMQRFLAWRDHGDYSCTGRCIDYGNATDAALSHFRRTGNPNSGSADANSAGNGALMRLAPILLHHQSGDFDDGHLDALARDQGVVTHAALASTDACIAFARLLEAAITATDKSFLLTVGKSLTIENADVARVMSGSWRGKERDEIRSSGYVIHSLEAAIWCFDRTTSFREAILLAANLGDDADTVAAITGQLAGAFYGLKGVPNDWRRKIAWGERIEKMGRLLLMGQARPDLLPDFSRAEPQDSPHF